MTIRSAAPSAAPSAARPFDPVAAAERLAAGPRRQDRLTHLEVRPAREPDPVGWPDWVDAELVAACERAGVRTLWRHQAAAATSAWDGQHTVVATGTASGKSLAYLLPSLTTIANSVTSPAERGAVALYVAPTKALARDQLSAVAALGVRGVRVAAVDGDASAEERDWARHHATYLSTTPDMLHHRLLPRHSRWADVWSRLTYVVLDECHHYRGVFGSHVAQIVRRMRRIAAHYGSDPTFVLASATVAQPGPTATRLVGAPVRAFSEDGSPHGGTALALWQPPFVELESDGSTPVRRSALAEAADLVADLVASAVPTLAFVRSRHAAEVLAISARHRLADVDPSLPARVAAYRGGYLPEDRREIEEALRSGELIAVAATNALELGIDISGLDAIVMVGYPGTRASMWQQVGRAGRGATGGLGVLVARDDPLDTYLVTHPSVLIDAPVEATVFDEANPYVLAPHLCAAAQELPLTPDDLALFAGDPLRLVEALVDAGRLRRRSRGWYWTRADRASDLADLRSTGGFPVRIVEESTGRVIGTVDPQSADTTVHTGAVYVHRGDSFLVDSYQPGGPALVHRADPDYTTMARVVTDIAIVSEARSQSCGDGTLSLGSVDVSGQTVAFLRRRLATGEVLGEEPLDLPVRRLRTTAVWWTLPADAIERAGVVPAALGGAVHAAEHAAIGLLPLFATCDRWDIGGVSTEVHPDTGLATVFVYDGHPGGAGFAARGFEAAEQWLRATHDAIVACGCEVGCPSCVQSPKCGNGNHPLDKRGAVALLATLLSGAPAGPAPRPHGEC